MLPIYGRYEPTPTESQQCLPNGTEDYKWVLDINS